MKYTIVLFSTVDENMQIRGKYENWNFMKDSNKNFLWKGNLKFATVTSALSFWLAFWRIFFKWLSNVSLLSIVTHSIFSSETSLIVISEEKMGRAS